MNLKILDIINDTNVINTILSNIDRCLKSISAIDTHNIIITITSVTEKILFFLFILYNAPLYIQNELGI